MPICDAIASMTLVGDCPISPDHIRSLIRPRGTRIEIPVTDSGHVEQFYGLGLQLGRSNQTSRKKTLRVNSDPISDMGDSHAPVPFLYPPRGMGSLSIRRDTCRFIWDRTSASMRIDRAWMTRPSDQMPPPRTNSTPRGSFRVARSLWMCRRRRALISISSRVRHRWK